MIRITISRLSKLEARHGVNRVAPVIIRSGDPLPLNAGKRLVLTLKRPGNEGPFVLGISLPPGWKAQSLAPDIDTLVRGLADEELVGLVTECKSELETKH